MYRPRQGAMTSGAADNRGRSGRCPSAGFWRCPSGYRPPRARTLRATRNAGGMHGQSSFRGRGSARRCVHARWSTAAVARSTLSTAERLEARHAPDPTRAARKRGGARAGRARHPAAATRLRLLPRSGAVGRDGGPVRGRRHHRDRARRRVRRPETRARISLRARRRSARPEARPAQRSSAAAARDRCGGRRPHGEGPLARGDHELASSASRPTGAKGFYEVRVREAERRLEDQQAPLVPDVHGAVRGRLGEEQGRERRHVRVEGVSAGPPAVRAVRRVARRCTCRRSTTRILSPMRCRR